MRGGGLFALSGICAKKGNPMSKHEEFDSFVATIAALRAPDGCPWDREQTHRSIAHNMIEEAFEAVDAIEADDVAHMREELGMCCCRLCCKTRLPPMRESSTSTTCVEI